jgi:hypothetical protein
MRSRNLRYGFLSTYHATVFVRRCDNLRFELSPPILWNATGPSVRECFVALGLHLTDHGYRFQEEPSDLNGLVCFLYISVDYVAYFST